MELLCVVTSLVVIVGGSRSLRASRRCLVTVAHIVTSCYGAWSACHVSGVAAGGLVQHLLFYAMLHVFCVSVHCGHTCMSCLDGLPVYFRMSRSFAWTVMLVSSVVFIAVRFALV